MHPHTPHDLEIPRSTRRWLAGAGVGAAVLAAAGIDAAQAIAFAITAQALTVLAGATIVLFTIVLHGGRRLLPA